jgi:hypothetical protein
VVAGAFFIFFGLIVILMTPRWADNNVKRFRQFNSEVDPNFFKVALGVVGVVAIILGVVEITRALRSH